MATFLYSPGIRVFINTIKGDFVEISDDLARGTINLTENQPHSFELELINFKRKYDQVFTPCDRVVIWLKRVAWLQVFAGYLDQVPYYTAYARTTVLTGTCSLKKIKYWAWDPNTEVSQGLMTDAANSMTVDDPTKGLTSLTTALMTKVANWPMDQIHMGMIPKGWFDTAAALWKIVQPYLPLTDLGAGGNPNQALGSAPGSLSGNTNAQKAFNFFVGAGWTKEQAAGIVGNILEESSCDPESLEKGGGGGCGLIQWTPCQGGLVTGDPNKDMLTQLQAIQNDYIPGQGGAAVAALHAATTIDDATNVFCWKFERPAAGPSAHIDQRISNAHQVFDSFANQAPPPQVRRMGSAGGSSIPVTGDPSFPDPIVGPIQRARRALAAQSNGTIPSATPAAWPGAQLMDPVSTDPRIADQARTQVGTSYLRGAEAAGLGFDAEGFVRYACREGAGINLGRGLTLGNVGTQKTADNASKGDLVFFGPADAPTHVGICLDGPPPTMMISAMPGRGVVVTPIPTDSPDPVNQFSGRLGASFNRAGVGRQGVSDISVYTNPLAQAMQHGLQPERIDQGVDYCVTSDAPLLALGAGTIRMTQNAGWPGGAFIALQLDDGQYAGNIIYYAEKIDPAINVGDHVTTGNAVGTLHPGSPCCEIGWGGGGGHGGSLGASLDGGHSGSTCLGAHMSGLLQKLGAPPGIQQGALTGTCPPGMDAPVGQGSNTGYAQAGQGGAPTADSGLLLNYLYKTQQDATAQALGGARAMLQDDFLLNYIDPIIKCSMRSYCSGPNGDFIAWFPDYFDQYKIAGVMEIADIELQDFSMAWSDDNLKTHVYVAGSSQLQVFSGVPGEGGPFSPQDVVNTYGVATVDFPQILAKLLGIDSKSAPDSLFSDPDKILKRFGARPSYTPMGLIPNHNGAEFWFALRLFLENWSSQFSSQVPISFMPEIFPGMLLRLSPTFNLQFYVRAVTHSFDFSDNGGFQTQVMVTAPSRVNADKPGLYGVPVGGAPPGAGFGNAQGPILGGPNT